MHSKPHVIRLPTIAVVAMIVAIAGLTILLWSAQRGRQTHLAVKQPGELRALVPSIVGLTQSSLEQGNQIVLLQNGDGFFPPMLRDIAAARQSIHVESYIWWEGDICNELAKLLALKAREGVEVRLLLDASGGRKLDDTLETIMRDAGVQVRKFHPLRISNLGRMNNRDHRKLVVVDGHIGYIGGFGIAKEWTGHAQDKDHWRDIAVRVSGPVVSRMQGAFCENWIEETGEIPAGQKYFPVIPPAGPTSAHLAYTSPTGSVSSVQVLYYLAISAARREVLIQNPYMLPDDDAIKAMAAAVKRGVDVRVMVPSTDATDSPVVQHAAHHMFGTLLKNGVKVYEYKKTLLHQKVMVVDGVWSCVGSTNFDDRSFQHNDEISMAFIDPQLAQQLRMTFNDDLKSAQQRTFREWSARPLWHKTIDGIAYLGHGQL
ncbi:MAG TPA: cardiolipin synthase [Thermoanaerobaculia bacterium]|nr:cardiolipin synthase [Thermoanaerobaculia bacterium]